MTLAPDLEPHCGSWIVVHDGRALCELFERENADRAAQLGLEVVTAAEWLARVNREISAR